MTHIGIEDWIEFNNLATRLGTTLDDGDADAWVACFTDDGSFNMPEGRYEGEARLRELVAERVDLPRIARWTAPLMVSVVDGEHRGEANGVIFEEIAGVPVIGGFALQRYVFKKAAGQWRVHSMTVVRPPKAAKG